MESHVEVEIASSKSHVSNTISVVPESSETPSQSSQTTQSGSTHVNSGYFIDKMPPLTLEEEAMVDLPVPDEIRYEFENYKCFPNNGLGEVFTYGDLWRYCGVNGTLDWEIKDFPRDETTDYKFIFPASISQLKSVKVLRFQMTGNFSDAVLIDNISKMTWLEELCIEGNNVATLEEIPPSMSNLKNLRVLDLSLNWIHELPDFFDSFERLEYLDVSWNDIQYLPPSLFGRKNLKTLILGDNRITKLPKEINKLSNLEELSLNGSPLEQIPDEICDLTNLKLLRLDGSSGISFREWPSYAQMADSLPKRIGELINLETLYIRAYPITKLPESIGNLQNLEDLTICLPLTELPESLGNLQNTKNITISIYMDSTLMGSGAYNRELEEQAYEMLGKK